MRTHKITQTHELVCELTILCTTSQAYVQPRGRPEPTCKLTNIRTISEAYVQPRELIYNLKNLFTT